MSPRYSQSADDRRPADGQPAEEDGRSFTTGIGSMVSPGDEEAAPPPPPPAPARPTFTARPDGPPTAVPEPALAPDDAAEPDTLPDTPALGPDDDASPEPEAAPAAGLAAKPVPPAGPVPAGDAVPGASPAPGDDLAAADWDRTPAHPLPATADLDEPLLSDIDGLRARWQRAQAGFVDDPQVAVGEAADLIEQTAQAMVGALRQRQRQLRVMWENGPTGGPVSGNGASASGAGGQDTEHLRQMMRHYRALFNQLCRP
jgi:hypothetical protein